MKAVFLFPILLSLFVGCSGNERNQPDKVPRDTFSFLQLDSMTLFEVLQQINPQSEFGNNKNDVDSRNITYFLVTYSPECPLCVGNIGELQRLVHWIDSVKEETYTNQLIVLAEQTLPLQYQWLQPFVVRDSAFKMSKKLGFNVYPELKIIKNGEVCYSGKLNNRTKKIGEKSVVNTSSDSSFIWNQWLNCHNNKNNFYSSNEAVGCYIE
jgi:hypothetical protein